MPRVSTWNDYVAVDADELLTPRSEAEVAAIVRAVRERGGRLRTIGGRHSFNDLALCRETIVDLSHLSRVLSVDHAQRLVTVEGGVRLRDLVVILEREGLALPNIGAWTAQTIAGVVSTATHGSCGRWRKDLIDAVVGIRVVDGQGVARELDAGERGFLTLGMFGVITAVTLHCEPLYAVIKNKDVVDMERTIERIPELLRSHDHVDLRWVGRVRPGILTTWERFEGPLSPRDRLLTEVEGLGLNLLNRAVDRLPVARAPARVKDVFYGAMGLAYVVGAETPPVAQVWHRGLTFNSRGFAPRHDEHEFAVPVEAAIPCLLGVRRAMADARDSAGIEVQIRFTPGVDLVLAPHYHQDSVWVNFNVFDRPRCRPLVETMTATLLEFGARPHWCKTIPTVARHMRRIHGDDAELWEEARRRADPDGVFLNAWYDRYLAPERDA
ncbi:MAG: FAD-binding protein [Nannocystaceae bacterium]